MFNLQKFFGKAKEVVIYNPKPKTPAAKLTTKVNENLNTRPSWELYTVDNRDLFKKLYVERIKMQSGSDKFLEYFYKSPYFNAQFIKEGRILEHPCFYQIIYEDDEIVTLLLTNITNSSKLIRINKEEVVTTTCLGTYGFEEKTQHAVNAKCEITISRENFKEIFLNKLNDPAVITKCGGTERLNVILKYLASDTFKNYPVYNFEESLKINTLGSYEKYLKGEKKNNPNFLDE